jgi:hypothetical protein
MARARAQEKAWRSAAFASFAVLALLLSSLGSTILGTSVAAPVIEGAQLSESRDFADGHAQLAETLVALGRFAKPLAASPPWRGSHRMTKEGNHGDDEQYR